MTHGWPGSVIELLETVGPLTDPTAHGGSAEDAFHLVLPSLPGYGFSGEPTELGWDAGRIAQRLGGADAPPRLHRYVAQGGDVGAVVTDVMGRQAPEGLLGIHLNVLMAVLGSATNCRRSPSRNARRTTRSPRSRRTASATSWRGHAAADDRLRPAGFTRRAGGLDARPRHGQLLQDLPRFVDGEPVGQSHPGPHRRQHHAVLADGHRRLGGPVVLGGRTGPGRSRVRPARLLRRSRFRSASRRSPARSGLPRAAGSRRSTPTSPTSTRSTGAATSPPGRSRSSSPTEVRAAFSSLR